MLDIEYFRHELLKETHYSNKELTKYKELLYKQAHVFLEMYLQRARIEQLKHKTTGKGGDI